MQIVKPVQLPQAAEAMAAAYSQVPIPFAILDATLQVVWQNEAMRTSCPAFCLARGLFLLTGEIPAAGIIDEIAKTGSFQVPFHPDDLFTARGLVVGAIPKTECYFVQALAVGDCGTGTRPEGLDRTLSCFESAVRGNLQAILSASRGTPGDAKIRRGVNAILRAVTQTLDTSRLLNGLYPSRKLRIELYPFLRGILQAAQRLLAGMVSFQYHIPQGQSVYTVTDTLLLTKLWGMLFSAAAETAGENGGICVEAIARETDFRAFISVDGAAQADEPALSFHMLPRTLWKTSELAAAFLGGGLTEIAVEQKTVYRLSLPLRDDECLPLRPADESLPLCPDWQSCLEVYIGGRMSASDLNICPAERM